MVFTHFVPFLENPLKDVYQDITIYIGVKKDKTTLFRNKKYYISVFLNINKKFEIITDIFDFVINKFIEKTDHTKKLSIIANWYIFSDNINWNIFDQINKKMYIEYRNMYNYFVLVNNIDGEIFFSRGIENKAISNRVKFLIDENKKEDDSNKEKYVIFSKELFDVYNVMEKIITDYVNKYYFQVKKIKT